MTKITTTIDTATHAVVPRQPTFLMLEFCRPTSLSMAGKIYRAMLATAPLPPSAWQPIESAPRDRDILIYHTYHGWVQAHYDAGGWTETLEGREYYGPAWVIGDGLGEEFIEETPEGNFHENITHWTERPDEPPKEDVE